MAAASVGEIGLDLVVNQNQFERQMRGITGLAKKAGAALAAAFATKKLVEFGKQCLELGSDLAEVQNVVDVTFPYMSSKVDEFAKSAITSIGMSETMAKKYTGTFGAMAKAFGFSEQQAYDMGTALTSLSGDVASFYNLSQDEAYTKLKSVFTGETESLKDLGVVMTQTALDSYAMANGFGKTTAAMSEAEKVALRYQFVQSQLSAAQGDFARTSGSWANQVRILKLQFDSLKATIGQGFINLFTPIIQAVNTLLGKLGTLANAFKSFTELITGNKSADAVSGVGAASKDAVAGLTSASGAADDLEKETAGVGNAAKKAAKEMKALMGFDVVQKLPEQDEDSSTTQTGNASGISIPAMSVDYGSLAEDSDSSFLDKLQKKLKGIDFSRITESLKHFKEELLRFGGHIGDGLSWILTNVLIPLGKWTLNEVVPRFFDTLANVLGILNPIITALKPLFTWFWEKVLLPVAQWTGGIFLKVWDGINKALEAFGKWCEKHPQTIQTMAIVIGSFFAAWKIVEFISLVGGLISSIGGFISTAGAVIGSIKSIQGALFMAQYGIESLIGVLGGPLVVGIAAAIAAGILLWKNWDTVKEKCGQLRDWTVQKFTELSSWLQNVFATDWSTRFGGLGDILNAFLHNVSAIVDSVKLIFHGIIQFVKGVFTGDWKKAWNGVKDIFKGIWDTMKAVVTAPINGIIGAINGLITGAVKGINAVIKTLNGLHFDIPDWVPGFGGKSFGFKIKSISAPKIPYLAQGGYVKPNTPQLAMIGDNRHQGEVVAPENKLLEMAKKAASMGGNQELLKQIIDLLETLISLVQGGDDIVLMIDSEELARATMTGTLRLKRRYTTVEVTL